MKTIQTLRCGLVLAFSALILPAHAQGGLDAGVLKLYGGTYSADCRNAQAPRLRVTANALMVEKGKQRMSGSNPQAAHSWFGQSPPDNYEVALLSEVRGGLQLLFIVYRDKAGQYATVDGDEKVRAALGKALLATRFRSCEVRTAPAAQQAPVKPATALAWTEKSSWDLLEDPGFKATYIQALGGRNREHWLTKLDGPSPLNRNVKVGGTEYLLASTCKPHDCADNNIVILWAQTQGTVYALIHQSGRKTLIGNPSPAMGKELDRIWRAEWRQEN